MGKWLLVGVSAAAVSSWLTNRYLDRAYINDGISHLEKMLEASA